MQQELEDRREYFRAWRKAHPEKVRAATRKWEKANPEKKRAAARRRHYRRKFGISDSEFDAMLAAQGFKCASCASPDPKSKNGFSLDHDHLTGKLRGILCHPCNSSLGMVNDNPTHLLNLVDYLEKYK